MDTDERLTDAGPHRACFGCGSQNPRGLRMRFASAGPGVVESRFVAAADLCGSPGVVHGGVQATLLDEAMGKALHVGLGADDGPAVTVDFRIRYRRPLPAGEVLVRGSFLRREGANVFLEGRILDAAGAVCTEAEARWRRVERRRPPATAARGGT